MYIVDIVGIFADLISGVPKNDHLHFFVTFPSFFLETQIAMFHVYVSRIGHLSSLSAACIDCQWPCMACSECR